jgi:SAM-dependent methyltransferase
MASLTGTQKHVAPGAPPAPVESTEPGAWSSYFEGLYRVAAGDSAHIPWADEVPSPALVAWLNREAPSLIRPGASISVVGCGLGEDVQELADRGYDVLAFDVSPSAVQWARRRHPAVAERFMVADLFAIPTGLLRRADLVVEINTIQSVHPGLRQRAAGAIASLARPRGSVLVICRGRDESEDLSTVDGPPFALSPRELSEIFGAQGMAPTREIDDFIDEEDPPQRRLRAAFRRA